MSILETLFTVIDSRKTADKDSSYTASLFAKGPAKCAEKFGEEAVEAIIAAAQGNKTELLYEAADVIYHLQVLLAAHDISWTELEAELARRQGLSGHDEKAARSLNKP